MRGRGETKANIVRECVGGWRWGDGDGALPTVHGMGAVEDVSTLRQCNSEVRRDRALSASSNERLRGAHTVAT